MGITININSILGMIGINYILTAAWDEKNKAAWDEWLKEGDIFEPDSADTMKGMDIYGYSKSTEHFTDSQGLEFLNAYLRRAQKNHQGLKFNAVFYGNDVVAECIKGETDPAKVEAFMRERLATLLRFKPSEMNVVIEPFDLIDGKLKWGVYPWYTVWGEEWPIKAFQFAREEAEKQGLIPGKDIMFYWCDWKLDQPSLQLDKTLEIIDKIKLNGDHIDGVGIEILLGENVRWYPHVPQKNEIMEVMHSVLEHVPHIFIDYETWHNSASSPKIVSIAVEVFKACVEINRERPDSVISFNVWDDYNPESPLDPKSFAFYYKVTYEPNMNYYDLEKEMIRILA